MKIVVIGGTGLIGSKVVEKLKNKGHDTIAAAPNTGVNTITGQGLSDALRDAEVVVDVANSPSFEDKAAMDFFQTSGRNLAAAESAAGLKHHIALSVVGTDRLQTSGYFRAKQAQEDTIRSSPIPYTLLHATQFFEFLRGIAQSGTEGNTVRLSHSLFQPMAAEDVATAVAQAALAPPGDCRAADVPPRRAGRQGPRLRQGSAPGRGRSRRALLRHPAQRQVAGARCGCATRHHDVRLVADPRSAAAEAVGRPRTVAGSAPLP